MPARIPNPELALEIALRDDFLQDNPYLKAPDTIVFVPNAAEEGRKEASLIGQYEARRTGASGIAAIDEFQTAFGLTDDESGTLIPKRATIGETVVGFRIPSRDRVAGIISKHLYVVSRTPDFYPIGQTEKGLVRQGVASMKEYSLMGNVFLRVSYGAEQLAHVPVFTTKLTSSGVLQRKEWTATDLEFGPSAD